uniref:Uncharacterized protein n=1 Tax=Anguilla anguilla TaxID=7936 RepID=A0A0E9T3V3_ANGAN
MMDNFEIGEFVATVWGRLVLVQHDNAPVHKVRSIRNGLLRFVWKNWTGLQRALTSTPLNTFRNWNADNEPGLIAQHKCPPSLMLLWLSGSEL